MSLTVLLLVDSNKQGQDGVGVTRPWGAKSGSLAGERLNIFRSCAWNINMPQLYKQAQCYKHKARDI